MQWNETGKPSESSPEGKWYATPRNMAYGVAGAVRSWILEVIGDQYTEYVDIGGGGGKYSVMIHEACLPWVKRNDAVLNEVKRAAERGGPTPGSPG